MQAVAARGEALAAAEDASYRAFRMERDCTELRGQLSRAREEALALRMQLLAREKAGGGGGGGVRMGGGGSRGKTA